MLPENIYGHAKRLRWIIGNVSKKDAILEIGCGTGYMITQPLAQMGYNILGVDTDAQSIAYGKQILRELGLPETYLRAGDASELSGFYDVIIASEVLEHIADEKMEKMLTLLAKKLQPGGKLLVTVPNGYGWFEMEKFCWEKLGLGRLLAVTRIAALIHDFKRRVLKMNLDYPHPSTLSNSPHVQRFTLRSIRERLERNGFEVLAATGSALCAGPFANLFFTGFKSIMAANNWLGDFFPAAAAGFFLAAKKHS